jgi:hypothetical protein
MASARCCRSRSVELFISSQGVRTFLHRRGKVVQGFKSFKAGDGGKEGSERHTRRHGSLTHPDALEVPTRRTRARFATTLARKHGMWCVTNSSLAISCI